MPAVTRARMYAFGSDVWYKQLMCPWDFPGRPGYDGVDPPCGLTDDELDVGNQNEIEGELLG